jgi:hypothetical protein
MPNSLVCMHQDVLKTKLQGASERKSFETLRTKRILEAVNWASGTVEKPRKHLIATLPKGQEVYFLKPGKEVANIRRPNPYDMTPILGRPDKRFRFDEIWSYLSAISIRNFAHFKTVLVLVYRNTYFMDHVEKKKGMIRYQPNEKITKIIENLENEIGDILPFGVLGLLYFLDILGWNEDVKYHMEKGHVTFSGKYDFDVGRKNTMLTCIRVPYQSSQFVNQVLNKTRDGKEVSVHDFQLLYEIMQQFSKSRGTCVPTRQQLVDWLSPYIITNHGSNQQLESFIK